MTATVSTAPTAPPETAAAPVPLTRLTLVELRKLADTRAGMWLLIVIGFATVATSAILLGWAGTRVNVASAVRWDHSLVTDRMPSTGSSTADGVRPKTYSAVNVISSSPAQPSRIADGATVA